MNFIRDFIWAALSYGANAIDIYKPLGTSCWRNFTMAATLFTLYATVICIWTKRNDVSMVKL